MSQASRLFHLPVLLEQQKKAYHLKAFEHKKADSKGNNLCHSLLNIDGDCTLQELLPPKRYIRTVYAAPATWSTTISTLNTDISSIIQPISLRFQPGELIYTDGSRKEVPDVGLMTGSAIYGTCTVYPVTPYGTGMMNTINRAELIAILVALRECRPSSNECIATDSRCFIQKIAKHVRLPSATVDP